MNQSNSLAPHSFCFKREIFLQPSFSVDVFLQELFNVTSLDNLRDDLGMYLKVLRSAMIELINEDYADFVNLSGNLIGLDKAIVNIQEELLLVLSSIKRVDDSINETSQKMLIAMLENQNLEEATLLIDYIRSIPPIMALLESHISYIKAQEHELVSDNYHGGPKSSSCVHLKSLKRASDRHNSLQYLCFQCLNTKISLNELYERVRDAEENLMIVLQSSFLRTIEQNDIPSLTHIIAIYSSLGKLSLMENLLHLQIIAPTFKSIFNFSHLSMDPFDLCGLMGKAKLFVNSKLLPVIKIIQSLNTWTQVDIVESCILPEFTNALENQLKIVFSHKDPDLYHKRFKCTMDFLEFLESISYRNDSSWPFKNNTHVQQLLSLWNLPVYFQIRYQEIAGAFESCLLRHSDLKLNPSDAHYFRATNVLLSTLAKCFDPAIYIDPLAHRFWKLFLQILSRHQLFYSTLLSKQLHGFEHTSWMKQVYLSESPKSSLKVNQRDDSSISGRLAIGELVCLYLDIRAVVLELPKFISLLTRSHSSLDKDQLEGALLASSSYYEETLMPIIGNLIAYELVSSSAVHMRSVSDIPRLYRRTNKEAPTKCSPYVFLMLSGLEEFFEANVEKGGFICNWVESAIRAISQQYHTAVSGVLTSVLKTEESLKRLRKDRSSTVPQGSSDDEKIRLQLSIDVAAFVEIVERMVTGDMKEIRSLRDLVPEHTKQASPSE